jgi:hypothetical protein
MRSCKLPALQSLEGNELLGNSLDGSTFKEEKDKDIIYLQSRLFPEHVKKLSKWKIIKHDAKLDNMSCSAYFIWNRVTGYSPSYFLDKWLEYRRESESWRLHRDSFRAFHLLKKMRMTPLRNAVSGKAGRMNSGHGNGRPARAFWPTHSKSCHLELVS